MKHFFLLLAFFLVANINSQNNIAKIEFVDAEKKFQLEKYSESLSHLEIAKELLGSTNAKIMYLEIMANDKLIKKKLNAKTLTVGLYDSISLKIKNLSNTYISSFENSVPFEKLKEIYGINKNYKDVNVSKEMYVKIKMGIKEFEKQNRRKLENSKRDETINFLLVGDAPVFPGCKKKYKTCFDEKVKQHFYDNLDLSYFKQNNIKRIFINLVLTERGEFIYINSADYSKIIFSEIDRVTDLLPKLEPFIFRDKPTGISYSFPMRIK
ncbi:hypothetical protein H9W90_03465 [Polaribacter pectinis]|uniref:TonB C-terminal domain-containing protein n=1 Tax=Polaribacter pectinis TaxID=2738844 RepID=A0A7G9LC42_9FLAO|nr:hypothetical protein [Polaribacter pectinis]QNM86191.1 hypothetical protein H9W90_03465 [Polaribacter pectinis]